MRAFLAILLEPALRDALIACVRALQDTHPPVRLKWIRDEQHHLTLHFLGEITPVQTDALIEALNGLPAGAIAGSLGLRGLGAFPDLRRPATLWAGGSDEGGHIASLVVATGRILRQLGTPVDQRRPFAPHFTLARVPRDLEPARLRAVGEWYAAQRDLAPAPLTQPVAAIHLMRSELLPSGARYTPLAAFKSPARGQSGS